MGAVEQSITFHYMYATEDGIPSGHTSFTLTETLNGEIKSQNTYEASSKGGDATTWINPFDSTVDGYVGEADPFLNPNSPFFQELR